ncbi:MAG: helix-turn-helix transcriptional regulator [Methylocystaceae bacterium]|nr:helix-turn-helix transcriptional regulator [Methylocystaceae bacterium]
MTKRTPPELGQALQSLRKNKNLTLDKLAQSSGISKSMLSQIERGQTNPTFATLWSLTNALGVEISEVLEQSESAHDTPILIEKLEAHFTPTIQSPDGKCTLKILSPVSTVANLEWYEMRIQSEGCLQSGAHTPGTIEHLTVLSGTLHVSSADMNITLKEGETARYRADYPHTISNNENEESLALLVVATQA